MTSWLKATWQFCRRNRRETGRIGVWTVAIIWSLYLWFRPPQPAWTSSIIPGGTNPIGFTADGHLVTADGDAQYLPNPPGFARKTAASARSGKPLRLTTWNLDTGEVVAEVARSAQLVSWMGIVASPNCDTIMSRVSTVNRRQLNQWFVLDTSTGQPRFPTIPLDTMDFPVISPDGRYAAMNSGWSQQNSNYFYAIIDLSSGTLLTKILIRGFQTKSQVDKFGAFDVASVIFSPDSKELLTFECSEAGRWIVFYSVPDGVEVARWPIPTEPKLENLSFSHWVSGKLLFRARKSGYPGSQVDHHAFECIEHELVPVRLEGEADHWPLDSSEERYVLRADDWTARVQTSRAHSTPMVVRWWNQVVGRLHPALTTDFQLPPSGLVQFLRVDSHSPIGVPIPIQGNDGSNFVYRISPDGQWLVDGGDRLRVYRTPPPQRWTRLPGVLLLLALGYAIDRRLRRKAPPLLP